MAAGLRRRRLGPLVGAGLLIGVVVAAVLANLAPKLLYDLRHGPNPAAVPRDPIESEIYGLRIAQLLAPIEGHRLPGLARLRAALGEKLPTLLHKDEAYHPALGAVASVGFLLLLGRFLARRSSAWPKALDGLALLNLAALLLAVTGGLGTVFNLLVSPMIRCYNRMSIFIACFALFALALLWEGLRTRLPAFRHRLAGQVALGLVLVAGILDQTRPAFVPPYAWLREAFASDADFVGGIEAALPGHAMVYQLPSTEFPEARYDQLRPYLHSQRLRWSFGTMKGRRGDRWRNWAAAQPPEELVVTLARAGFAGIHVNRAAYADRGADVEARLARVLGAGPSVVSRDGDHLFFGLAGYADRLRSRYTAAEWTKLRREALEPPLVGWGPGFYAEERWPGGVSRWSRRVQRTAPGQSGGRTVPGGGVDAMLRRVDVRGDAADSGPGLAATAGNRWLEPGRAEGTGAAARRNPGAPRLGRPTRRFSRRYSNPLFPARESHRATARGRDVPRRGGPVRRRGPRAPARVNRAIPGEARIRGRIEPPDFQG